jgi:hypothetical protein
MGSSPNPTGSFSFNVPAGNLYTIVVSEVLAASYCPGYKLQVSAAACPPEVIKHVYTPLIKK